MHRLYNETCVNRLRELEEDANQFSDWPGSFDDLDALHSSLAIEKSRWSHKVYDFNIKYNIFWNVLQENVLSNLVLRSTTSSQLVFNSSQTKE